MEKVSNIISGPSVTLKKSYASLGKCIYDEIQKFGSEIALVDADTNEEWTYEKIINDTRKLAVYLQKEGLTENDRVGICSENNLQYATSVLSTLLLGITICPVNPLYTKRELKHLLSISKPKYIFVSSAVLPKLQEIVKELSWSPKLILLNKNQTQSTIPNIDDIIKQISDHESRNLKIPTLDIKTHVAGIFCSSGTTGMPKGVMLTDENFLYYVVRTENYFDNFKSPNKRLTLSGLMPFFHGYGFTVLILLSLRLSYKLIVFSRFEERKLLTAIEKYKIDILTLIPSLMVQLLKSPIITDYNLSSVKGIISGGAKLLFETETATIKLFNLDFIKSIYGMTEVTVVALDSHKEFHRIGSVGKLDPGFLAKVVGIKNENYGEALGPNCEGEICFKGPCVMKGYCDDTNSTKNIIDADGWLHTGDVGYYDEDGYFFIVGRIKELIKYKGYQVAPAELESILIIHPSIKEVAVVGLPDEEAGELPLAFVVKESGVELTEKEVVNYLNERVSAQKRLRGGVRFINEMPKNAVGKLLRRELRNML